MQPKAAVQGRIHLVDALRGFALMGLFLVHCVEYFELYWMKPEQSVVHDAVFFLFAGKSYAIFAMLFGLSFFIIMDRQAAKGRDFGGRFAWRLAILFAIGSVHSLLYLGDILQVLALAGFSLLLLRRLGNRTVFILSVLCMLQWPLWCHFAAAMANIPGANNEPLHWALYGKAFEVFAHGSLRDVMAFNAWNGMAVKWLFYLESGRTAQMLGLFMWGLILGRIGFFGAPEKFVSIRRRALVASVAAAVVLFGLHYWLTHASGDLLQKNGMAKWYLETIVGSYLDMALMIVGVLIFVRLYANETIKPLFDLLAPCGRMSLTMYLSQALLCVPLFYPFGLGWHAGIGQAGSLLLGAGMYAWLVAWAHWWMRRFRYGPAEWLWRAATYTTFAVPLRRAAQPVA